MSYQYPNEIQDQQEKVKQELNKLAKMQTDHLIAIGMMPASHSTQLRASGVADRRPSSPMPAQSAIKS